MKSWSGGRNVSLDMSGEYRPCSGFSYERTLFLSDTLAWCYGFYCYAVRISAHVTVDDSRRKFKCWAEASFGSGRVPITSGRCRSIRDALSKANAAIAEKDATRQALIDAYGRPLLVTSAVGKPFASLFTRDFFILPEGDWIATHSDGYVEDVSRRSSGYSTIGRALREQR
jgi:hypothetical protein